MAHVFSSEDPESLRGPQFDAAWCDELGKWKNAEACWDMLQFGLRRGREAHADHHHDAEADEADEAADGRSVGDAGRGCRPRRTRAIWPKGFVEALANALRRHAASARQELEGELIEDRDDALWSREMLAEAMVSEAGEMQAHRRGGGPAGEFAKDVGRVRDRGGGAGRRGQGGGAGGRDGEGARSRRPGRRRRWRCSTGWRRTASSPR